MTSIDAKYDRLIRETIEQQLRFEPSVETKNRKPLRPPAPFAAQWEIRFGPVNRDRFFEDFQTLFVNVRLEAGGVRDLLVRRAGVGPTFCPRDEI